MSESYVTLRNLLRQKELLLIELNNVEEEIFDFMCKHIQDLTPEEQKYIKSVFKELQ